MPKDKPADVRRRGLADHVHIEMRMMAIDYDWKYLSFYWSGGASSRTVPLVSAASFKPHLDMIVNTWYTNCGVASPNDGWRLVTFAMLPPEVPLLLTSGTAPDFHVPIV
jgi:hypothetical protein